MRCSLLLRSRLLRLVLCRTVVHVGGIVLCSRGIGDIVGRLLGSGGVARRCLVGCRCVVQSGRRTVLGGSVPRIAGLAAIVCGGVVVLSRGAGLL